MIRNRLMFNTQIQHNITLIIKTSNFSYDNNYSNNIINIFIHRPHAI